MIKNLHFIFFLCFTLFGAVEATPFNPKASLVEIEINRKAHSYKTPWSSKTDKKLKSGILIGPGQILTTSAFLSNHYLLRIRKSGSPRQYTARLKWVDYHANVAILDVADPAFWKGMKPVPLAKTIPLEGEIQTYRQKDGRVEERKAEIIRIYQSSSYTSYLQHLKLSGIIQGASNNTGWSGGAFDGDQLIGWIDGYNNQNNFITILPASFIALAMKAHEKNTGLGYFDFDYMHAKNPALLISKGLHQTHTGVVVTETGRKRLAKRNILKPGDVILSVDGFEVDNEGNYMDPQYGPLSIKSLATRKHLAGASIPISLWRDHQLKTVDYVLPEVNFKKSQIPEQHYDAPPEYLIAGGLVFQPINGPLIRSQPNNLSFALDLDYYSKRFPVEGRDGFVLISSVLPDPYNKDYEDLNFAVVDQINGRKIHRLKDVEVALKTPKNGFHWIQFLPGNEAKYVVLDAESMSSATSRILSRYNIRRMRSK